MPTDAQRGDLLLLLLPVDGISDTFHGQGCDHMMVMTPPPPPTSRRGPEPSGCINEGTEGEEEPSSREQMKMELTGVFWVFAAAVFLLWSAGGSAAPTECHFNSRALCEFEGRHFSLGETWMDAACMQCTCLHPIGVGCCEMVQRPVDFPAWCEVRVEPATCKAFLVQTADRRLPCSPGSAGEDPSHGSLQLQQQLEG